MPYLRGMRSELAVPVLVRGESREGFAPDVLGVLNIECSQPGVFNARHKQLVSSFMQGPIAAILQLAERHNQLIGQERRELDDLLVDSSVFIIHDVTRPIRQLESRVGKIRELLPENCVRKIEDKLQQLESDSRRAQHLVRTGLLYLNSEILETRAPLDVIEHLTMWADKQKPPVQMRWHRNKPIETFFIDRAHPLLITSVLNNLYENSRAKLEERGEDGLIWLDCKIVDRGDSGGYFDVYFHDNGSGITLSAEARQKLFRMFARRRDAGSGGWGMGLPLARQMMEVMHGELDFVASKPQVDTVFRLRFAAQPRLGR